ncbi:MAG: hypothetical protein M1840_008078 [Geoglossum simile]|nr:MAG: hypothetical protein M1840_008078 [Geoglossum simile]
MLPGSSTGPHFQSASLEYSELELQNTDLGPTFDEPAIDVDWAGAVEDTRPASRDPIYFCLNPADGVIYLFDSDTHTAYPLHPSIPSISYTHGQNPPYPEIPADWVLKVSANKRRLSQEGYQGISSDLMLSSVPEGFPLDLMSPPVPEEVHGLQEIDADEPSPHELMPSPINTQVSEPQPIDMGSPTQPAPADAPHDDETIVVGERQRPTSSSAPDLRHQRMNFNASEVYPPLSETPQPWSSFTYYRTGELKSHFLSVDSIREFLYCHPLHTNGSGVRDPKNSGLELFIQRVPSDSSHRYPRSTSNLCRFGRCFVSENKLHVGHFRLCFSEKRTTGLHNPYHNAGYVHLYCLENFMNFPQIARDLNVNADTRKFPMEPDRNVGPMEIDRTVRSTAQKFLDDCQNGYPEDYPAQADIATGTFEGTLTHRLHVAKLEGETPGRARARLSRGRASTHISHLGNLRMIQGGKRHQRHRLAPSLTPPPAPQPPPIPSPQPPSPSLPPQQPSPSPPPQPPSPFPPPQPAAPQPPRAHSRRPQPTPQWAPQWAPQPTPQPPPPPPVSPQLNFSPSPSPGPYRKRERPESADPRRAKKTKVLPEPDLDLPPPDPTHAASTRFLEMQEYWLKKSRGW